MRLSAQMYDSIVEGLRSDSHRDKDKRREPRVGLAGEVEFVTVNEAGKRIAAIAKVRDVSRSGVGLLLTHAVSHDQRFVIQLESAANEPIWLICTTAYCRGAEVGRFSVGARILQLLRAEDIQRVEAKAAAAVSAKPRAISTAPRQTPSSQMADIARIAKAILE